jgi:threonine/homoserine/homoserine lactone efflux protein
LPTLEALALFLVVTAAYSLVPGPAVLLIVSRAMLFGPRIGAASVAGISTMNVGFIVLAALGVGVLVESFPSVFRAVQWVGAAYIVWIAVQTIRHPVTADQVRAVNLGTASPRSLRAAWLEGIVVQGSNPKAILYLVAFLPQFVDPGAGAVASQMAVLCTVGTAQPRHSPGSRADCCCSRRWACPASSSNEPARVPSLRRRPRGSTRADLA